MADGRSASRVPVAAALAGLALAVSVLLLLPHHRNDSDVPAVLAPPTPPPEPAPEERPRPLPADAILLAAAAAEVVAPFAVQAEPSASGGLALVIPKGAKTDDRRGRARLKAELPQAGVWRAWARVRWRDECSNSVTLSLNGGPGRMVGEDRVFKAWHWVRGGEGELPAGPLEVTLAEREDGIVVDQFLFTQDAEYEPAGMLTPAGERRGVRRFADDFSRSPGHGLEAWYCPSGEWRIQFSFDPNRIPCQYALIGRAAGGREARTWVKGTPWYGCVLSFSLYPLEAGRFGALVDGGEDGAALALAFELAPAGAALRVEGPGLQEQVPLGRALRAGQWHRVTVERWAWHTRVFLDGRPVWSHSASQPRAGRCGLFVASGSAAFDDVALVEAPWVGEDGAERRAPWTAEEGSAWRREGGILVLKNGALTARMGALVAAEAVLEEEPEARGRTEVRGDGLAAWDGAPGCAGRVFRRPEELDPPRSAPEFSLRAGAEEARVRRVAVRFAEPLPEKALSGPYHFTEAEIEDPSDYLDFTTEEYREMARSPEASKLLRRAKRRPLVGRNGDETLWNIESGTWRVQGGCLTGTGPGALAHYLEVLGDLDLRMKVRLAAPAAAAEVALFEAPGPGVRLRLAQEEPAGQGQPALAVPAGGAWHTLELAVRGEELRAGLDGAEARVFPARRGDGGRLLLRVLGGRSDFDDIELAVPRTGPRGAFAPFQRCETDWWREAPGPGACWLDHGGISCVLASSWTTLLAPRGDGLLWSKREFTPDLALAFDVQEYSEWFGWDKPHSHEHHPFDHICAVLAEDFPPAAFEAPEAWKALGYRLEVNAEERSVTILYRLGQPVARVAQNGRFPIQYHGGHAPYSPRTNRIELVKRGPNLRGIVNGKEVLAFADSQPLPVRRAAVGGFRTHINFTNLEVRNLGNLPMTEPRP